MPLYRENVYMPPRPSGGESMKDENTATKELLLKYARDPNHAALFNYASAAHNNHFFFDSLSPSPISVPPALLSQINTSFSSFESLRSHFLATADSMFGPGYVWLVKRTQHTLNESMRLSILATYNAGSPYPGAHFRLQPLDMNTANTGVTGVMSPYEYAKMMKGEEGTYPVDDRLKAYATGMGTGNPNSPAYKGSAGSFGAYSNTKQNSTMYPQNKAPGGALIEVLLGVSTWEHVWLWDWGIAGKRKFLEGWWEKIDWEVVLGRSGFGVSVCSIALAAPSRLTTLWLSHRPSNSSHLLRPIPVIPASSLDQVTSMVRRVDHEEQSLAATSCLISKSLSLMDDINTEYISAG
ncbi:MAG: hypothetical protein Q9201_003759 [Fulgogasparrea decipioides]